MWNIIGFGVAGIFFVGLFVFARAAYEAGHEQGDNLYKKLLGALMLVLVSGSIIYDFFDTDNDFYHPAIVVLGGMVSAGLFPASIAFILGSIDRYFEKSPDTHTIPKFTSKEHALKIAEEFGVTDRHQLNRLKQRASEGNMHQKDFELTIRAYGRRRINFSGTKRKYNAKDHIA